MNISKLALIALLGGALMAFGCGSSSDNGGGTGGTGGGTGGTGGGTGGTGGGTGGTGGAPVVDGMYTFTCNLSGLPIPLPVTITINADDPGFTEGVAADLATSLDYNVAPDVIGLLPGLAPASMIQSVSATVGVAGGMPATIDHPDSDPAAPFAPIADFTSGTPVTTSVTPDAMAASVDLSVSAFSAVIDGIPENLVPGGSITLEAGVGDCGALDIVEGSGPLSFSVAAAN